MKIAIVVFDEFTDIDVLRASFDRGTRELQRLARRRKLDRGTTAGRRYFLHPARLG